MITQKKFKNITYIYMLLSIIISFILTFGVSWRGSPIITNTISFDIELLDPIKTIIIDTTNLDVGTFIYNIFVLNIIYYVFIVFPISLLIWLKGVFSHEK